MVFAITFSHIFECNRVLPEIFLIKKNAIAYILTTTQPIYNILG